MTHREICKNIVIKTGPVEAAIIMSGNGLPLAWYTEDDTQIDEIASISAGLLAAALEQDLFQRGAQASMVFNTQFGALAVINIDADSMLVLCITDNDAFPSIQRRIRKILQPAS